MAGENARCGDAYDYLPPAKVIGTVSHRVSPCPRHPSRSRPAAPTGPRRTRDPRHRRDRAGPPGGGSDRGGVTMGDGVTEY